MKNKLISLVFCLCTTFMLSGKEYYFSNISLKNGLSQISVICIHQDMQGFMWFGTRCGLNRFDGYTFKVFLHETGDSTSISDNNILCIAEDSTDYLWIGTNDGLNRYNKKTNVFRNYFHEKENIRSISHNTISALCFDEAGVLWIGTSNGICRYNPTNDSFERISIELLHIPVIALKNKGDKLYIATFTSGLIIYDIRTQACKVYKHDHNDPCGISHNYVRDILIDKDENLWLGTYHEGVDLLKKGEKQFIHYNQLNGLTNNYVRCLNESPDGKILVGTLDGLNVIDPLNNHITTYNTYDVNHGNLSHYSVFCICFDRSQTLWVGTYAGGINYHNPYSLKFRSINLASDKNTMLGIMGPVVEIKNKLYIATEGGGLLEYDKSTETSKHYKIFNDFHKSYGQNILKSLFIDKDQILCGTNVGTIYSFDPKTKQFSLLYDLKEEKIIYHINKSKKGALIVGNTGQSGLVFISTNNTVTTRFAQKNSRELFSIPNVRCVLEINDGVFLIGTRSNGLYKYDTGSTELIEYKERLYDTGANITENYITDIIEDSKGNIWIGTFGGGIYAYDRMSDSFISHKTSDNLLNNVCTIVEGDNDRLWISAICGILEFNKATNEFSSYNYANGIEVPEFTPHAGLKLSDGNLIFSGNNGVIIFNPSPIKHNPYIPPIVLNSLSIDNKRIEMGGEDGILQRTLNEQKRIVLKYDQSNITIAYSALNYILSDKNQYAYILEGFDEKWNMVGSRRVAYYTKVPAGNYRFIVKGSNNDGVWNDNGACLEIIILPPFWKTWWAYCIYIFVIIITLSFIYHHYSEKRRLKNDIKLRQIEAKAQNEFYQARNRLFTNFSHELRTPLTLIISPLDDMVENSVNIQSGYQKTLKMMQSNAHRLLRLVNNLMDFQKKESGTMSLKVSQNDFVCFSKEMVELFDELAASRMIQYTFHTSEDEIISWFDKNLMEKVYFNLLSNAFKNVPNRGSIDVSIKYLTVDELEQCYPGKLNNLNAANHIPHVAVEIKDSGIGIVPEELEKIFIPFYQIAQNKHSSSGTGLGLSLSKSIVEMHHGIVWAQSNEEGANFIFIFPVSKDCFTKEELNDDAIDADAIHTSKIDLYETDEPDSFHLKGKHTILIVEDNQDVRRYIVSHLSGTYNILEASDGKEAIETAIAYFPDLILSDLMMPNMDGMEMCKILKTDLQTSHIPIIMITARAMASDMKSGYEIGADDYIVKPFNASVLKARVRNIIQSREKLKELYGKRFTLESLGMNFSSTDERFMQKLYNALEKNISNSDLNMDSLSKEIGISKANLYRKIKTITNHIPNEFIRKYRLEMAAKILKETNLSISDVYVSVGFNSLAYFSNCFKALYGVSPSEYLNQSRQQ